MSVSFQYASVLVTVVTLEIVAGILAFVFRGAVVSQAQVNCNNKAGQTKFTVYRHRFFDFACGRAIIIQMSN